MDEAPKLADELAELIVLVRIVLVHHEDLVLESPQSFVHVLEELLNTFFVGGLDHIKMVRSIFCRRQGPNDSEVMDPSWMKLDRQVIFHWLPNPPLNIPDVC